MVVDEIKDMYRQGEHHIRLLMKVLSTTKNMKKNSSSGAVGFKQICKNEEFSQFSS